MQNIKNFTKYTPDNPPVEGAGYLISEDGQDWYECQMRIFMKGDHSITSIEIG